MRLGKTVLAASMLFFFGACAGGPEPEAPKLTSVRPVSIPDRDVRVDDNLIALVAEKTQKVEGLQKAVDALTKDLSDSRSQIDAARESGRMAAQTVTRLELLLNKTTDGERKLQLELVQARLNLVRANQEIYKAKIARLLEGETK